MAESERHRTMKRIVRQELEDDRYRVVEEPPFPPTSWLHWEAYHPDLLGYRYDESEEQVVVAECETHPSMRKMTSKNYASLSFEPSVLRTGSIRRILAVPRVGLASLDMRLRRHWEIWVLGDRAPVVKISSI